MHDLKLIELTGLANAAERREVVLPDCERRAAQAQVLADVADTQTTWWRKLAFLPWCAERRHSGQGLVRRTPTTVLPDPKR